MLTNYNYGVIMSTEIKGSDLPLEVKNMKKTYKAVATVTDGAREWDVVIYSLYKTIEEANDGIYRFASHGYNIVKAWVE